MVCKCHRDAFSSRESEIIELKKSTTLKELKKSTNTHPDKSRKKIGLHNVNTSCELSIALFNRGFENRATYRAVYQTYIHADKRRAGQDSRLIP